MKGSIADDFLLLAKLRFLKSVDICYIFFVLDYQNCLDLIFIYSPGNLQLFKHASDERRCYQQNLIPSFVLCQAKFSPVIRKF